MLCRAIVLVLLLSLFAENGAQLDEVKDQNRQKSQQQSTTQAQQQQQQQEKSGQTNNNSSNTNTGKNTNPAGPTPEIVVARLSATTLASSAECALDIQKHCAKGMKKPINNQRVLQCIDDLDNVRNSKFY